MKYMLSVLTFITAMSFLPAQALAHDEPGGGGGYFEISQAARDVSVASEHFHIAVHNITGYNHLSEDAHRLGIAAAHFQRAVDLGADFGHVRNDYLRLRQQYAHLAQAFNYAHGAHHVLHLQRDFQRLQFAMEDLSYAMGF